MELWELVAREAIRDTIARYNHAGDAGRFDEMIDCFTPDGRLTIVGPGGGEHLGHASLRAFFTNVRPAPSSPVPLTHLRHCVTNTLIEVVSPSEARAASYFQVITDIGLDHWGRYRDVLVADDGAGRWRFAHRSVKTDGWSEASGFRPTE